VLAALFGGVGAGTQVDKHEAGGSAAAINDEQLATLDVVWQ